MGHWNDADEGLFLPFIIRHTNQDNSSEALSLSASTWSLSTIFSGLIISTLDWISYINVNETIISLDERTTLWLITTIGISSVYFAWKIDENDQDSPDPKNEIFSLSKFYDWKIIFKAISPLVLISVGAGLTIPFVNLFFNSIFGFDSSHYSMMGSITAMLVFIFSLLVPTLRKKYGYWMTIVVVQSLAIACLVIMSITCLLYTSPSPRDLRLSRMPSSA